MTEFFDYIMPPYSQIVGNDYFDNYDPAADKIFRYACSDSDYTLRIYHMMNESFDKILPKHRYITEKIESPTAVYVGIMQYKNRTPLAAA
jgi:DNA polymerase-1